MYFLNLPVVRITKISQVLTVLIYILCLQDNRDLLKKPDVIEQVVKNLDKKNAKKLLDLVKGKF